MPSVTGVDDMFSVIHDHTLDVASAGDGLLGNDIGSSLSISVVNGETYYGGTQAFTLASGGIVTIHDDGTFNFQAAASTAYTESFDYTVTDGIDSDSVTASIDVTNAGPTAYDFTLQVKPNGTLPLMSVGDFAADADSDVLTPTIVSGPTHGTLSLDPYGTTYSYTVTDTDYVGTDSFTYKVNDGIADSATKTVTINIGNTAPVIGTTLYYTVLANNYLSLASLPINATDVDGDDLSVVIDTYPTLGGIPDPTYYASGPNAGTDSFTYHVTDGYADSGTVTVYVTIIESGLAVSPVLAKTDNYQEVVISEDKVLVNAMSTEGSCSIAAASGPAFTQPSHGTVTRDGNGDFVYLPTDDYTGADSFTVSVFDGVSYAAATVYLQVALENSARIDFAPLGNVPSNLNISMPMRLTLTDEHGNSFFGLNITYTPQFTPAAIAAIAVEALTAAGFRVTRDGTAFTIGARYYPVGGERASMVAIRFDDGNGWLFNAWRPVILTQGTVFDTSPW